MDIPPIPVELPTKCGDWNNPEEQKGIRSNEAFLQLGKERLEEEPPRYPKKKIIHEEVDPAKLAKPAVIRILIPCLEQLPAPIVQYYTSGKLEDLSGSA